MIKYSIMYDKIKNNHSKPLYLLFNFIILENDCFITIQVNIEY